MDARGGAHSVRTALIACGVGLLLAAPPAGAETEPFAGFHQPDLIEMSGHVGKPFPEETGGWNLKLGVKFTPTLYDFHLSRMRILNSGRLPGNVLSAVEPYRPNFFLFGSSAQMAALAAATPQDVVTITGYRRIGSRVLMLTEITVAPPMTPSPTPSP